MSLVLRTVSLILIVIALMLLGADMVSSLERHGQIIVRSLDQVWTLTDKSGVENFHAWLTHALPAPLPGWIGALLALPAWALTGVIGVVLAFLFGRRPEEA